VCVKVNSKGESKVVPVHGVKAYEKNIRTAHKIEVCKLVNLAVFKMAPDVRMCRRNTGNQLTFYEGAYNSIPSWNVTTTETLAARITN
jgi:hypothetical protein